MAAANTTAGQIRQQPGVCIELLVGEVLRILVPRGGVDSDEISITLEHKSGQRARMRIKAKDDVTVARQPAARRATTP